MTLLVPSLTNKRLPSEPLLHNTCKTLFAFLLCLFSGTVATMLVTIPLPFTTDCLKVLGFFSTILIGLVFFASWESHVIDFRLRTFLFRQTLWLQDPISYSESLLTLEEESSSLFFFFLCVEVTLKTRYKHAQNVALTDKVPCALGFWTSFVCSSVHT